MADESRNRWRSRIMKKYVVVAVAAVILTAAFTVVVTAYGCRSAEWYEQHEKSWEEWIEKLRTLASEVLEAERDFWPDPEEADQLRLAVRSARPDIIRELGWYIWDCNSYTITLDCEDKPGELLIPWHRRAKRGKAGVRKVYLRVFSKNEDGPITKRSMEIGVNKKTIKLYDAQGKLYEERTILGSTVIRRNDNTGT